MNILFLHQRHLITLHGCGLDILVIFIKKYTEIKVKLLDGQTEIKMILSEGILNDQYTV